MSTQELLGVAGGIFMVAALAWNAVLVLRRKVKPALASWAIWGSLDAILAVSMYAKGVLNPQMAAAAVGAGIVFLLSIPYGKPGWNPIDKWCLTGGIVAVALWFLTGNASVANFLTLAAIAIGCVPTYASIKEDPSREDKTFWCLVLTSSVFALVGTTSVSLDALAQPVVFVIAQGIAVWLLFVPQKNAMRT
ncbi:MAG: hypothetical protein AAB908_00450 [Patescibacteria group bacterium]